MYLSFAGFRLQKKTPMRYVLLHSLHCACQLRADDENWNRQLYVGSKFILVSLLFLRLPCLLSNI